MFCTSGIINRKIRYQNTMAAQFYSNNVIPCMHSRIQSIYCVAAFAKKKNYSQLEFHKKKQPNKFQTACKASYRNDMNGIYQGYSVKQQTDLEFDVFIFRYKPLRRCRGGEPLLKDGYRLDCRYGGWNPIPTSLETTPQATKPSLPLIKWHMVRL